MRRLEDSLLWPVLLALIVFAAAALYALLFRDETSILQLTTGREAQPPWPR